MPQSLGISLRLTGVFLFHVSLRSSIALLSSLSAENKLNHPLKVSFRERSLIYYPYLWIAFFPQMLFTELSYRTCLTVCASLGYRAAFEYYFTLTPKQSE